MKLTRNTKRASGMTLLELTVVILVLLSLISILFIGARAWKKGSDRAASILTIRNVQQAVRSFSNMNGHNAGDTVASLNADLFGAGKFIENDPTAVGAGHPAGTGYAYTATAPTVIPAVGTLYLSVTGTDAADYMPTAGTTDDW
jgi:type II secretory pathway pseudopilin PulG